MTDLELTEGPVQQMVTLSWDLSIQLLRTIPFPWPSFLLGSSQHFRIQSLKSRGFLGRKTACAPNILFKKKGVGRQKNGSRKNLVFLAWVTSLLLGPSSGTSKHCFLSSSFEKCEGREFSRYCFSSVSCVPVSCLPSVPLLCSHDPHFFMDPSVTFSSRWVHTGRIFLLLAAFVFHFTSPTSISQRRPQTAPCEGGSFIYHHPTVALYLSPVPTFLPR